MPRFSSRWALAALLAVLLVGCEEGLRPDDSIVLVPKTPVDTTKPLTGIAGTIVFRGARPPADSLLDLRVVAFYRKFPIDSIFNAILSGQGAYDTSGIALNVDTAKYVFTLKPHLYTYIVVAQQFSATPPPVGNWRAVGVYAPSGNDSLPGAVNVPDSVLVKGIDITVDYDHPPPP